MDCLLARSGLIVVDLLLILGALWGLVFYPHHLLPKPQGAHSPAHKPRQETPAYLLALLPFSLGGLALGFCPCPMLLRALLLGVLVSGRLVLFSQKAVSLVSKILQCIPQPHS